MILIDTGPFVALFAPKDAQHDLCKGILKDIRTPLTTKIPVLTEAFHMLFPESYGSDRLRDFVLKCGVSVFYLDPAGIERSFELMEQYADHPMNLADASLLVAAESLHSNEIFTLDQHDFEPYRIPRGHRHIKFEVIS
ncbi:MAG: PIN domain-containing protein [Nitrospirota bacterium]